MNRLDVKIRRRDKCPNIAGKFLDKSVEDVIVSGVPATRDIDDGPEESFVGFVAFIWIPLPKDRDIGMKTLKKPIAVLERPMVRTRNPYWLK